MPEGRFAAVAADLGGRPLGFAQFLATGTGALDRLRLTMSDGEAYDLARD